MCSNKIKIIFIDEDGKEKEVKLEELSTRHQDSIRYYPATISNPIVGYKKPAEIIKIDYNCNINCINCTGCEGCIDCENCEDCSFCVDCKHCKNCKFCTNCYYCVECINCVDCCIQCKYCTNCYYCIGCKDCKDLQHTNRSKFIYKK